MVAVVTDSASNLPPGAAEELGVQVVPLLLHLEGRTLRDGIDLTPEDLYRLLAERRVPASTAMPSHAEFLAAFQRAGDPDVVCVTVASTMSGVHHQAVRAAEAYGGRVEVVDSGSASMAEGFVVLEAARAARAGGTLEAVAARAREVAGRAWLFAAVDTFDFLRASGRVSSLQAYAGTVLDIKPVFVMRDGVPRGVARPRTRRRALDRVVRASLERIGDRSAHLAVVHAAAAEDARAVGDRIAAEATVVERHQVAVTPVIGAHTGPGLLGTAFFCD